MKYTNEELRSFAKASLAARDDHDMRWLMLLTHLTVRCGISIDETERRIVALAA